MNVHWLGGDTDWGHLEDVNFGGVRYRVLTYIHIFLLFEVIQLRIDDIVNWLSTGLIYRVYIRTVLSMLRSYSNPMYLHLQSPLQVRSKSVAVESTDYTYYTTKKK
jgi:hypothetical protein